MRPPRESYAEVVCSDAPRTADRVGGVQVSAGGVHSLACTATMMFCASVCGFELLDERFLTDGCARPSTGCRLASSWARCAAQPRGGQLPKPRFRGLRLAICSRAACAPLWCSSCVLLEAKMRAHRSVTPIFLQSARAVSGGEFSHEFRCFQLRL